MKDAGIEGDLKGLPEMEGKTEKSWKKQKRRNAVLSLSRNSGLAPLQKSDRKDLVAVKVNVLKKVGLYIRAEKGLPCKRKPVVFWG